MTDVKSCTVTLRPRPGDPSNRDFMLTNAGDPTCLDALTCAYVLASSFVLAMRRAGVDVPNDVFDAIFLIGTFCQRARDVEAALDAPHAPTFARPH